LFVGCQAEETTKKKRKKKLKKEKGDPQQQKKLSKGSRRRPLPPIIELLLADDGWETMMPTEPKTTMTDEETRYRRFTVEDDAPVATNRSMDRR